MQVSALQLFSLIMLMNFPEIPIFHHQFLIQYQTMITYQERDRIFCLRNLSSRQCHSSGRIFSIVEFSEGTTVPLSFPHLGELRRVFSEWKIKT
ncbi:hypothetical protein CEXT_157731 [Caerostris extrusa]|uniref:Uncharacterized protein n=1 Tax=Caerostris extrusa TaxID=172846 RepID=A0AAV4PPS0_CAEEX|nr:hypothetical protein CEXT_157731 [Caerostris extrusa]